MDELRVSDDILNEWMSNNNKTNPLILGLSLQRERIDNMIARLSTNDDQAATYFDIYTAKTADMLIVTLNNSIFSESRLSATQQHYLELVKAIIKTLSNIMPYKMIPVAYPGLFRRYLSYLCAT